MKIGAMNHPRADYIEEIKWIAQNGFDFIDLTCEPPQSMFFDPVMVKKTLDYYNLEAIGHSDPTLPAIYPIKEIRNFCLDEFKKTIDNFHQIGIHKVNIHPFYNAPHLSDQEVLIENIKVIKIMSNYCQSLGIELMLENFIRPFNSVETFLSIVNEVPNLKVHLDIGHCNLEGDAEIIISHFFEKLGSKIIHLHMHDNDGEEDEHLPLGCCCGNINWPKMIKFIKDQGYDNSITLEVFCDDPDFLLLSKNKLRKMWNEA